jgi:uncharacterized lipoprotein YddW (UPF0748 family)
MLRVVPQRSRLVPLTCFFVTLSLILWFSLILPVWSQSAILPRSQEIRGVWLTNVDSEVLFNRAYLRSSLRKLASLNFNTLYPVVWNWGYTLYPSETAVVEIGYAIDPRIPALQDQDALANVVELGHQHNFTVIPWFEFGFMTTADSEILTRHPDWLTQRRDGTFIWDEGIYQRAWLNPFKPEVQDFIQTLILEIVDRYDIDGIQFDDHLGLPSEFGYDDYTVQLYRQEHDGKAPPADPLNREWVRWRANKMTDFMKRLFQEIKSRKEILISLSPNRYEFAYNNFLQDWLTWEREGLIEELILQVYTDNLDGFTAELDRPEVLDAKLHIPTAIGVLTGLKDRPVPIRQVRQQVQRVREKEFPGVSFFFFETLWNLTQESSTHRQAVFESLFRSPTTRPNILEAWRP